MWPDRVVVLPPIFNHDPGLNPVAEPLHGQTFIPEFAVEAFRRPVLPGFTRIDQGRFNALVDDPFQERHADEFRTVIASQVARRTPHTDQLGQHLNDPG